ncbi:MAG: NfeD family protein [Chloroflexota bacterium]
MLLVFIWLIVAIVAAIGEMATTGLFLATFAGAAAITAIVSLVIPFAVIQLPIFAGLSLVGIAVIRPVLIQILGIDAVSQIAGPVTHSHIIGRRAIAVQPIDAHGGQIRIGQGEFWSAHSYDGESTIPIGEQVEIVLVDGIVALVAPVKPLSLPESESSDSLPSERGA